MWGADGALRDCSFNNNYDKYYGDAIYFHDSGNVSGCIFYIYRPKNTSLVTVDNLIYYGAYNYWVEYMENDVLLVKGWINNDVTFSDLNNGRHVIIMSFYKGGVEWINNIVITADVYLNAANILMFHNDGTEYKVKVTNHEGTPVANFDIQIRIAGHKYNLTTDDQGYAKLPLDENPGTYTITVESYGNNFYSPSIIKTTLKILNSPITKNRNMIIYFLGGTFKVQIIKLNGKPVGAGKTVKFTIAGKTYTKKTNKHGYATYKILQKPGKYTITTKYSKFAQKNTIKIKPVLTAKNVIKKKTKTTLFKAKLVKTNGKAYPKKTITFKFKGKTYKKQTNKHGIATLKIKNLKIGKYKIYTKYKKSTIKNTITIKI